MTDIERRNVEMVKKWEHTWNTAVDRMVDECYAPNCEVVDMMGGRTFRGREELRKVEHAMLAADSTRHMEVTNVVASGNTVAIEMDSIWSAKRLKSSVFLTFNDQGLIVLDHSYGADPSGGSSKQ
jgi:hypothetical protein